MLGIQSGNPLDFERTPLGPLNFNNKNRVKFWKSTMAQQALGKDKSKGADVRAWESAGAGHTFDLEGPDAQAVTMPPAPRFDSDKLIGEMAEVYLMALLRDLPFALLRENHSQGGGAFADEDDKIKNAVATLRSLKWFDETVRPSLDIPERLRHRKVERKNLFRGIAPGDDTGPYLSQFLLLGNKGVNGRDSAQKIEDGYITYCKTGQRLYDYLCTVAGRAKRS